MATFLLKPIRSYPGLEAAWWASPQRQYPVALAVVAFTPTMQVLRDAENARVVQTRYYYDPGDPAGPPESPMDIGQDRTCVGTTVDADPEPDRLTFARGYVRFPLPNLPDGVTAPTAAHVVAVPDNTLTHPDPSHVYYGDRLARLPTYLLEMSQDWRDDLLTPGVVTIVDFPAGMASPDLTKLSMIKKVQYGWPNTGALPAALWDVTAVVQSWYANPDNNFGFALRMFDEGHHYFEEQLISPVIPGEPVLYHSTRMCFPASAAWSNLDNVVAHLDDPQNATADGPGLGLLVTYSAPQLAGDSLSLTKVPSVTPLQSYRYQYHEYRLPAPQPSRWQIAAVQGARGLGDFSPNTPLDLANAAGEVVLSSEGGRPAEANANYEWQPNYVVVNGSQGDLGVRVQPDNQPMVDEHDDNLYVLQTQYAGPSPALPPNVPTTVPLAMSDALVVAQELDLAADTTVEIRIPYAAVSPVVPPSQAAMWDLQVFPPSSAHGSRTSGGVALMRGPDAYEVEFSVSSGESGPWLLVLQSQRALTTVAMPAQVTVCQNTDQVVRYPLDGECVELRRPPAGFDTDPNTYKEIGTGAGRLRVWSPAGFDCAGNVCTTRPDDPANVPVMPLLGYGNDALRWVALKNGTLTLDPGQNQVTTSAGARLVMADFSDAATIRSLPVLRGAFEAVPGAGTVEATSLPADTYLLVKSPLHVADDKGGDGDKNGWAYDIDLAADRLRAQGPIARSIQPNKEDPSVLFDFDAEWSIDVTGGSSLLGQITLVDVSDPDATFGVGTLLVTAPASGYSLEYSVLEAKLTVPAVIPAFAHVRMVGGTVFQPDNLGGARLPVQALLLPPGRSVKEENGVNASVQCGTSCFDLRGDGDVMGAQGHVVDRQYTMPDLIVQDSANAILINSQGRLEVLSTDHPMAGEILGQDGVLGADDVSFSYEAFDASVKTYYGICPGPRDPLNPNQGPDDSLAKNTTVVIGRASMSLPNAESGSGDDGNSTRIEIGFTLCENSLREMSFEFDTGSLYALPIGNSGLWLHLVGGTVSLAPKQPNTPGYTTVVLRFGFRGMAMAASASNLFFTGQVTIDSRGLFDVQAQAGIKVLATGVGADGHFWVAWSPLDLGFVVDACLPQTFDQNALPYPTPLCTGSELLYGLLKLHTWQGQGWQNMYSWLPDDDALHAAARFEAQLTIGAGAIVESGLLILPPGDVVLAGLKLAFGEFCMNQSCTQYEWGVMGAFVILGYDIAAYYGFDSGISFSMGSADYVLIDEAGQVLASPSAQARPVAGALAAGQVITIRPGLPSALFALGGLDGSASLTLREPPPGNRVIVSNPQSPPDPDLFFFNGPTPRGYLTLVSVDQPLPGDWIVEVNGVAGEPYNLAYFANNPAPALALGPLPTQAINQPTIPLTWTSDAGPLTKATISLYWELLTDPINRSVSGPIVERLPLTAAGSYDWDITNLASGSYGVYARIDSNAAEVVNSCPDQTYNPDPYQQGACGLMLAPGVVLPVERVDAPGGVRIFDSIPPQPPAGFKLRAEGLSSVVGRWLANGENDLAGYILTCSQNGGALTRSARVSAAIEFTSPVSETARVNGLDGVPATCFVQTYDATGNLSTASVSLQATPSANIPLPPAPVQAVQALPQNLGDVLVQWSPSPQAHGYLLYYYPFLWGGGQLLAGRSGSLPTGGYQADQGPPPIVTYTPSQRLTGLADGTTYEIWVVPFDADGRAGEPSAVVQVTLPARWTAYLPLVCRGY